MSEKEHVIKMIERVREKVEECDPIAVEMLDKTTDFLEDLSNTGGKVSHHEYENMRHQIKTIATKFSNSCSCIKKV